jgi:hypothetical protein
MRWRRAHCILDGPVSSAIIIEGPVGPVTNSASVSVLLLILDLTRGRISEHAVQWLQRHIHIFQCGQLLLNPGCSHAQTIDSRH